MHPVRDHATPYCRLDPDTIIQAIESTGLLCDGRFLTLNSYHFIHYSQTDF